MIYANCFDILANDDQRDELASALQSALLLCATSPVLDSRLKPLKVERLSTITHSCQSLYGLCAVGSLVYSQSG